MMDCDVVIVQEVRFLFLIFFLLSYVTHISCARVGQPTRAMQRVYLYPPPVNMLKKYKHFTRRRNKLRKFISGTRSRSGMTLPTSISAFVPAP